jgi:hypothetical protein
MTPHRPPWVSRKPGDPVFVAGGIQVGTVTHVSPDLVLLDLGYPKPTLLKGPCIQSNVVRLGSTLYFTAPK